MNEEALHAMKENGCIWCPTLSTIGNLRGKGRFDESAVCAILDSAMENVAVFASIGGIIAPGTDAGAWAVPQGSLTEFDLLREAIGKDADAVMDRGTREVMKRF